MKIELAVGLIISHSYLNPLNCIPIPAACSAALIAKVAVCATLALLLLKVKVSVSTLYAPIGLPLESLGISIVRIEEPRRSSIDVSLQITPDE